MEVFILAVIASVVAPNTYERLASLSTAYEGGPLDGWLEPSDFISEYYRPCRLFMRTDLFIVDGEDLVEKLRVQLGVEKREQAVSHFFDMNKPEVKGIVAPHIATLFRRDLYHLLQGLSADKVLFVPVIEPLRDLLSEYVENRARFPFYDFLPQIMRKDYLHYFTPIPWEEFPVRPGAPGSGVVAYIPKCSDRYEHCEKYQPDSDDDSSGSGMFDTDIDGDVVIVLQGKEDESTREDFPTRLVNTRDGRSADYNFPGNLIFDTEYRKVITSESSRDTTYDCDGFRHEWCRKRWRPSSYAFVADDSGLVIVNGTYPNVLTVSRAVISDFSADITALESRGDHTPQQAELLKYMNHMRRREYEQSLALVSNLGFDMEELDCYDYIAASIREIIEDGTISGRLRKRRRI